MAPGVGVRPCQVLLLLFGHREAMSSSGRQHAVCSRLPLERTIGQQYDLRAESLGENGEIRNGVQPLPFADGKARSREL